MAWYLPIAARDSLRGPNSGVGEGAGVIRGVLLRLRQALLVSVRLLPRTLGVLVVVWGPVIIGAIRASMGSSASATSHSCSERCSASIFVAKTKSHL